MAQFVDFLKQRISAPVPDWWATDITNVELFRGVGHAFPNAYELRLRRAKSPILVPDGVVFQDSGDAFNYVSASEKLRFAKDTFAGLVNAYAGVIGKDAPVLAGYRSEAGYPYQIAGFAKGDKKPIWTCDVWAAIRGPISGLRFHTVELRKKGSSVFIFGEDCNGMYLEAFDQMTGKCLFRFCTCYWGNPSEQWDSK